MVVCLVWHTIAEGRGHRCCIMWFAMAEGSPLLSNVVCHDRGVTVVV